MIFSGFAQRYRCKGCGAAFANVTPTSLLPTVFVIASATLCWSKAMSHWIRWRWLRVPLGLIVAFGTLWALYAVVEFLTTRKLRRHICLRCGGPLEHTGNAFYDGLSPNPWELLVDGLTFAIALTAMLVMSRWHR